jgi:alkylation response protein AidB-like acyl-CoA dehydrogenase
VDFELTADQEALQDGVRKLCEGRFPIEQVRALEERGGVDRALWQELAAAGVFALRVPEADGGVGLGHAEAAIVFEELGRAVVPGPLVGTHLAAGLVDGDVVGVVERRAGAVCVEHLDALDTLVAIDDDGLWEMAPSTLDAQPVDDPLDPLTPLHRVDTLPRGSQVAGAEEAGRWRATGAALVAAELLGIAGATTDMAVAFAKEREQFDRPIGSFQAVKHLLADMLVRAEVARAAVYAAAVTLDDAEVGDVARAVATAKVMAGEAAVKNGKSCVQVHGGMGFTWEVDAHLYLKRAWLLDTVFGSVDDHALALAVTLT